MKLYYAPGACSIGIHYLLEQIGAPYEQQKVDIRAGENKSPQFTAINPKAKVPTLQRDDGSVLTEFPVIAQYLAASAPNAKLLPSDPEQALRAAELTNFIVTTLHTQGFSRIFRPAKFVSAESEYEAVKAQGHDFVRDGLEIVERDIGPGGPLNSIATYADAALFYSLFWAVDRLKIDVPTTCAERYAALRSSPAAARVFEAEGIAV